VVSALLEPLAGVARSNAICAGSVTIGTGWSGTSVGSSSPSATRRRSPRRPSSCRTGAAPGTERRHWSAGGGELVSHERLDVVACHLVQTDTGPKVGQQPCGLHVGVDGPL
jgi:hypothetical protein